MSTTLVEWAGLSMAVLTLMAGCAAPAKETAERGFIVATTGGEELTLPMGVQRAVIYEIDGVRVPVGQRSVQVSLGAHTIRAAPLVPGPMHQVPSAEWLATRLHNLTVTVEVVAGTRYLIGVRWLEPLNYQRAGGSYEAVAFTPGALSGRSGSQDPP